MKKAAKVFLILTIVLQSMILFSNIAKIVSASSFYFGYMSVSYSFNIAGIIVSAIALGKLGKAKNKNDLTAVGICCIIFGSLVAGILLLCMKQEDLSPETNGLQKQQWHDQNGNEWVDESSVNSENQEFSDYENVETTSQSDVEYEEFENETTQFEDIDNGNDIF